MSITSFRKKNSVRNKSKKKNDTDNTFFLYVAFHSVISSIMNIFTDD